MTGQNTEDQERERTLQDILRDVKKPHIRPRHALLEQPVPVMRPGPCTGPCTGPVAGPVTGPVTAPVSVRAAAPMPVPLVRAGGGAPPSGPRLPLQGYPLQLLIPPVRPGSIRPGPLRQAPAPPLPTSASTTTRLSLATAAPAAPAATGPTRPLSPPHAHRCAVCKKRFSRPSALTTHLLTHTGAQPFQCDVVGCGKRFNVKSNLVRHKKIHAKRHGSGASGGASGGGPSAFGGSAGTSGSEQSPPRQEDATTPGSAAGGGLGT
ncbi:LAMI_0H13454g1_1 [Lachancea mirantina]|uniref:LAMI_0H13454g1_1 n=1 Tax=Lachancea mirantina TaxID=1230905 RepID=A0A1G4KHZ5_9SACH|nr:LAMI_0H13454g1_1 [Lachancea mirantina]